METTTNIKELVDGGYLEERGGCTNHEVLVAATAYMLDRETYTDVDDIDQFEVYEVLWDECNASLALELNNTDISELLREAVALTNH